MNNFLQFARFLLSPRLHLFILWCFPPPCHQFIMNSNQNFLPLRMSYLTISLAIYTQLYSRLQDSPTLSVRASLFFSVIHLSQEACFKWGDVIRPVGILVFRPFFPLHLDSSLLVMEWSQSLLHLYPKWCLWLGIVKFTSTVSSKQRELAAEFVQWLWLTVTTGYR